MQTSNAVTPCSRSDRFMNRLSGKKTSLLFSAYACTEMQDRQLCTPDDGARRYSI
jgi:hypothetical protein